MTLKWPVPVYPLPDEILSSWLVRAAFALGCEPMSLTSALWPSGRTWTMDIDRYLVEERMQALSDSSGLSPDEITRMTLRHHLDGKVFLYGKGLALLPWLTTLGQKHLQHIMGVQFCPECFRSSTPYYRWQWRTAWFTRCSIHQCPLVASCPVCHTAVQYHRLSLGAPHIGVCVSCGYDFREIEVQPPNPDKMIFQTLATHICEKGVADWGSEQIPAIEWFALMRVMLHLIRKAARQRSSSHLLHFFAATGIDLASFELLPEKFATELLLAREREALFAALVQMIAIGPEMLLKLIMEFRVPCSVLMDHRTSYPEVMHRWLANLPTRRCWRDPKAHYKCHQIKSREMVRSEWILLLRKLGLQS